MSTIITAYLPIVAFLVALALIAIGAGKMWLRRIELQLVKKSLEGMRNGTISPFYTNSFLYDPLQRLGLSLEDVGTTKSELRGLQVRVLKEWLKEYRAAISDRFHVEIAEELARSILFHTKDGLTLAHIGTWPEELQEWRQVKQAQDDLLTWGP